MSNEEVTEVSNDEPSSFTLTKQQWYAVCEWRVCHSVFEQKGKMNTGGFEVDGRKWRIFAKYGEDGKLSAGLRAHNRPVHAHFAITLANHEDKRRSLTRDALGHFGWFQAKVTVDPFITASEIKDPSSGYLKNDFFTLRLELRVRRRRNESLKMKVNREGVICNWKIHHAWEMSPSIVSTDIFKVGGHDMKIKLCKEEGDFGPDALSVLIANMSDRPVGIKAYIRRFGRSIRHGFGFAVFEERIDSGASMGWVRLLKRTDLLDPSSSFTKNDFWLRMCITKKPISYRGFRASLGYVLSQTPQRSLPQIENQTKVHSEGRASVFHISELDDISHSNRVTQNNWYASYEWCVPDSFLMNECSIDEICYPMLSNAFALEDRRWCIGLRRNERGSLLACLVSKNETRVDVQFGFTLVNCDTDEKSHRTGHLHEFSFMDDFCEHELLPCSQIASQDFGFLRENCFLVRLDMRLKRDDSESCQISVDKTTAVCQWKLRFVGEMSPWRLATETIRIGHSALQVFLYPSGSTGLSSPVILIKNLKAERLLGHFTVRAVHCNDAAGDCVESKSITFPAPIEMCRIACHRVIRGHAERWLASPLTQTDLEDKALGFVKEGWVTIEIKITLFKEREFDEEIAHIPRSLDQVPCTWSETDCDERIRVEHGAGADNGIRYSFVLNKYKYYATYECWVFQRLMYQRDTKVSTKPFELDGGNWHIDVQHLFDGQLGVALYNEGVTRATAHFAVTLVNHNDEKNIVQGGFLEFFPAQCGDFLAFCPTSAARAMNFVEGFKHVFCFSIRAEIRLKLQDNERWRVSVNRKTATCTWKLKGLQEMCPSVLRSEIFKIGTTEWELKLQPEGNSSNSDSISLHLHNRQHRPIRTRTEFRAVNWISPRKPFEDKVAKFSEIVEANSDWSIKEFLTSDQLADASLGFVNNGWCEMCRKDPTCSAVHGNTRHKCYCKDCALSAIKEILCERKAIRCPVCQQVVHRIIMQDTTDEKKALGMHRCKSAVLSREIPPTKTIARETAERLGLDEASDQIVIKEVLRDGGPSRLKQCKSAAVQIPIPDASNRLHTLEPCRFKSSLGGLTADSRLDNGCQYIVRRCESME